MELKDKAFETYPAIGNGTRPTLQLVTVVTLSDAQEILEAKEKEIFLEREAAVLNIMEREKEITRLKELLKRVLPLVEHSLDCSEPNIEDEIQKAIEKCLIE